MGLLRMAARTAVIAGTATAVSGRIAHRQANRYDQQYEAQQYEAQQQQPSPQPPAADAAPQDETIARLNELAHLHSEGVLSDDEFAGAKAKALGI